eukprot:11180784-Lingulodinium_polyedra.AAC.1
MCNRRRKNCSNIGAINEEWHGDSNKREQPRGVLTLGPSNNCPVHSQRADGALRPAPRGGWKHPPLP